MRLPFRRRRPAQRPSWLTSALLLSSTIGSARSQSIRFEEAPSANLDLSNLGRIGFAGDFDGISLYEYEGQNGRSLSTNGSESLLAQMPNGAMASIVSTDASIRAMCTFMLSDGEMQGVVIGGNFTSMDGIRSTAVALFNPNNSEVTPLDGLEGEVNAIYCDEDRDTVYVGGSFKGANSTNAIAWVANDGWTNLPFAGFNGPVEAITKAPNGHIIFGGTFTGLGNASAPTEPDNQAINLSTANISAENSISTDGFSDPENIICSDGSDEAGSAWLVQDDTPGFWEAEFGFGFEPTKLRLANTHQDGRGTRTFRFIALPIDGIMNFTYVDPATGQNSSCSSECPLSDDPEVEYQEFHFVNRVGMNRFRLAISDWYGSGAGLAGISLYQDNIFSYAVADFNEPSCGDMEFPSTATATGPWSEAPSGESNSRYLTAELDGDIDSESASVVFTPSIRESGNYSINVYTPGCRVDDTCSSRGRVNITGVMAAGSADEASFTTTLYQTNDFDKYDQVYFGYIERSSDNFRPSVTLTPLANQNIDPLTIVAQRVGFTFINSTGGLNGLFEYDPSLAVIETLDLENSTINKLGASFDQETGVKNLITADDIIYIAGNFTSREHENIVAITNNDEVQSLDGGLNGRVLDMYHTDNKLYVGGEFSNTLTSEVDGMNHVAVYDSGDDTWSPLGAGVDGLVHYVVPLRMNITEDDPETVIAISGSFSEIRSFGDFNAISVDGFAIWVPSEENWLQNIDTTAPSYKGLLTAALLDLPTDDSIYAGSISSAQLGVNGAATLDDEAELGRFPVNIQSQSSSSQQLIRRDGSLSRGNVSGVVAGIFYDEDDHNITVLAGHFTAQSSNGSVVENLVIIDGGDEDDVSGLGSAMSSNSTFAALELLGSTLYAGGSISGTVGDSDVNGIITYDIVDKSFGSQPPSVGGWNATVSAISVRPDSNQVFVAGSFTRAGALDCPGLCIYDSDDRQWVRPGNDFTGNITSLLWSSNSELIVGGDLRPRGSDSDQQYLALYDSGDRSWSDFPGADQLPGPVEVMTAAADSGDQVWVAGFSDDDGSGYLMKYNGDRWLEAEQELGTDTVLRGLQVFTLTEDHEDTDILDKNQALMLTGSIAIPDFGTAGAAIFNGTHFLPYAIVTGSGSSGGTIAKIFSQKNNFFSSGGSSMALGFVVLIGLAVALGLMFLLVLGGLILDRLRKRREGYTPAPTSMYDRGSGIRRIPPQELLQSLGRGRPGAPHV